MSHLLYHTEDVFIHIIEFLGADVCILIWIDTRMRQFIIEYIFSLVKKHKYCQILTLFPFDYGKSHRPTEIFEQVKYSINKYRLLVKDYIRIIESLTSFYSGSDFVSYHCFQDFIRRITFINDCLLKGYGYKPTYLNFAFQSNDPCKNILSFILHNGEQVYGSFYSAHYHPSYGSFNGSFYGPSRISYRNIKLIGVAIKISEISADKRLSLISNLRF